MLLTISGLKLSGMSSKGDSIYYGNRSIWYVFYEEGRTPLTVEIGGIKYGYHDQMQPVNENGIIARSDVGTLYRKDGSVYYQNTAIKIDVKLSKRSISDKLNAQRNKIYTIMALSQIRGLEGQYKAEGFNMGGTNDDFLYYKENVHLPSGYQPGYLKRFYEFISKK